MTALAAPRPAVWLAREQDEDRLLQGSLFGGEALAPAPEEIRVTRVPKAPPAGPTLDDAVSRAWESLAAGVAAACPVCRGELEPAAGGVRYGRCGTCDLTLE